MGEYFGYLILLLLAAYLVPRLISAAFFQSLRDFKRDFNKPKGSEDGPK